MQNKKDNLIIYLSVAVLFLAVVLGFYGTNNNQKTYDVSIYVEGDKASLARVADLMVEYDKANLELVSTSTGGFMSNSNVIKKDDWEISRALMMSTSVDTTKPILRLKFRGKNRPTNIKLSENSLVYLANIGSATIPSNGIEYRVKYEQ